MKIVIDAGKRSPDGVLREYMFNSATARYVIELLKQYEGVETMATFDDSRDVPLSERTDRANNWRADIFISIHANAMGNNWSTAKGIETFEYLHTDPDTDKLATTVHRHMLQETGCFDRGVKRADFHVIRETNMPSILIECGFMDNHDECALLCTDEYRRKCAKAIVGAIVELYALQLIKTNVSEDVKQMEELLKRVCELENKVMVLEKTAAPDWFVTEFGAGCLNGIVNDPVGDENFWRNVAVSIRTVNAKTKNLVPGFR
jgi:hypothetical protein